MGPSVFVSGFLWPPESSEGLAPPVKRSLFLDNFQSVKLRTASIAGPYRNAVATFALWVSSWNKAVGGLLVDTADHVDRQPFEGRGRTRAARSTTANLLWAIARSWNVQDRVSSRAEARSFPPNSKSPSRP